MGGFIRRFTQDPGLSELLSIEGAVIIDNAPPATIAGASTGVVTAVGEFEDGEFASPLELSSGDDLLRQFGGFGFTYDGVESNNPCARARYADNAVNPEYWNGNGFLALVNKKFSRLIVVRVDTTVGAVQFRRLANVVGVFEFSYKLEDGQTLALSVNGAAADTATFNGNVAVYSSGAGTYPIAPVGGEVISIAIDEGTPEELSVDVVLQSSDTTQAAVIARINAALGYTAAVDAGGGVTEISGRVPGSAGGVDITAVPALATGIAVASVAGGGNVSNISQVTFAEIKTVVEAAITGVEVHQDAAGRLRINSISTAANAEVAVAAHTATALGFVVGDINGINDGLEGTIPAGTRVTDGTTIWVTAQSQTVAAGDPGPYTVRVRPAIDDGTAVGAAVGAVDTMSAAIAFDAVAVTNEMPIAAALTESAIDAAYVEAIDSTLNPNAVSRSTGVLISARQSNVIRGKMRQNAVDASAEGLSGRGAIIRPPLNTSRALAKSLVQQPGVGAYRHERVWYAYPGVSTYVPQVAKRGLAGGAGFTADGYVDLGFDAFVASAISQFAPEENPAQENDFMLGIAGFERGNADVQDMRLNDYKAFRALGIMALRFEGGKPIIQSGVTSVDSQAFPNLKNVNRRRMADYIQDSVAPRLNAASKKLGTRSRRAAVLGELNGFLAQLESDQRIEGSVLDGKGGNTPDTLALGLFRILGKVRTIASMDVIVFVTEIGESVTLTVE